jgi:hypothetical protein
MCSIFAHFFTSNKWRLILLIEIKQNLRIVFKLFYWKTSIEKKTNFENFWILEIFYINFIIKQSIGIQSKNFSFFWGKNLYLIWNETYLAKMNEFVEEYSYGTYFIKIDIGMTFDWVVKKFLFHFLRTYHKLNNHKIIFELNEIQIFQVFKTFQIFWNSWTQLTSIIIKVSIHSWIR